MNSGSNSNSTSVYQINERKNQNEIYKFNNRLKESFNKKIWLEHQIGLFQKQLDNGSTPPSLFYSKFPEPYLNTDENFVKEYNLIIEQTQRSIIKLCISSLINKVEKVRQEITSIKEQMSKSFEDSFISNKLHEIERNEEYFLKDRIQQSFDKFNRITVKPFAPKKIRIIIIINQKPPHLITPKITFNVVDR